MTIRRGETSPKRLRTLVEEARERWPDQKRIGVRLALGEAEPRELEIERKSDGRTIRETARVVPCRSSLELRQRLSESEGSDEAVWVFLADLSPTELGADVEARLAKGGLIEPRRWNLVCGLFRARYVDPRLSRHGWIADLLIESAPASGYRPVASGVLDEATARRALVEHHLGLGEDDESPASLAAWASEPGSQERYDAAPAVLRERLAEWWAPAAGPFSAVLVALLEAGRGREAVPLGRVVDFLEEEGRGYLLLSERYLGRLRPSAEALRAWSQAAGEAVRRRANAGGAVEPWSRRAQELAAELVGPETAKSAGTEPRKAPRPRAASRRDRGVESTSSGPEQLTLVGPRGEDPRRMWIDRLLASEVYAQQVALAGRRPPAEAQVRDLLAALDAEGGVSTLPALSRILGTSRLRGLLSQASRILNVDGYSVLTVDDDSETARLDRALLEKQFGL